MAKFSYHGHIDITVPLIEQFHMSQPSGHGSTPSIYTGLKHQIRVERISISGVDVTFTGPRVSSFLGKYRGSPVRVPVGLFNECLYSPFQTAAKAKLFAMGLPVDVLNYILHCVIRLNDVEYTMLQDFHVSLGQDLDEVVDTGRKNT